MRERIDNLLDPGAAFRNSALLRQTACMTTRPFTLKMNPLRRTDLDDFVAGYNPANRHDRVESERFRAFGYDELMKRDKGSLDIFWLRTTASSSKGTTRSVALLSAWSRSWRQTGASNDLATPVAGSRTGNQALTIP